MPRESVGHTLKVAALLCVVCSVLVSSAAVGLRDRQRANQERARKANILSAAGLDAEAQQRGVEAVYAERVEECLVDLESGRIVPETQGAAVDSRSALRDPQASVAIPEEIDVAGVGRREKQALIYLVSDGRGTVDQVVLPIRGYGLWSTLWGFIALDAAGIHDGPAAITVRGLTYYQHGETPGLGGEVDNPRWQAIWRTGKRVYEEDWNVALRVVKGEVAPDDTRAAYKVDGLSGATITSNGVTNMIRYWFGPHGYRPFLENVHRQPELLLEGAGDG